MSVYQFSFGPNRSYFCNVDDAIAYSENLLPTGLEALLTEIYTDDKNPRDLKIPYDVAFPMEDGLYTTFWLTGDSEWYKDANLSPNYAKLRAFIDHVTATGEHITRTVFGLGFSYFSTSAKGVALGVQGSYVVLYDDATVTSELHGLYPLVEALLCNTDEISRRRGIMYLALSPFVAGEYYAVYGDFSTSWNLPTAWIEDITSVSQLIASEVSAGGTEPAAQDSAPEVAVGQSASAPIASAYTPVYAAPLPSVPLPPAPPVKHSKVNWKEGIELGLKAMEGITKIIEVIQDQDSDDKC
ncbi:hypothetical protein B0H19DRAFT_1375615 [Mycena capillaripes]|nr:hypothetical protein B0H19DRAFT_1375615 [Mycena capillaripes]